MESTSMRTLRAAAALRQKWQRGNEFSLLGWLSVRDTSVAEMETMWGYDGLIIDTEHSTYTVDDLQVVLMAFRGTDCVPIVRVGDNSMSEIKRALDLGATGILIPMIESAADAAAGVSFCRYPPQGTRGFSPRRASDYFRDITPYLAEANDSIVVLEQMESYTAYQNLDAILAVPGIDCFFIGQADLSSSMGYLGNPGHPEVQKVVADTIRRCRAAGHPVAVASVTDPKQINNFRELGANVISAGGDTGFMMAGFNAFKASLSAEGVPFTF